MHIFHPASSAFLPLTWVESIGGNPSCSIANSLGASFIATAAREGLERALVQAETRETSGMMTSLDDTRGEAEGGGGPGVHNRHRQHRHLRLRRPRVAGLVQPLPPNNWSRASSLLRNVDRLLRRAASALALATLDGALASATTPASAGRSTCTLSTSSTRSSWWYFIFWRTVGRLTL